VGPLLWPVDPFQLSPTWIKPLVTLRHSLSFEYNQMLPHIRARCDEEHSRAPPTQFFLFFTNFLAHFYTQHHWILYSCRYSLHTLGAISSVSSQRHLEHIVDLNRSTMFRHLLSTKPAAVCFSVTDRNVFEMTEKN